MILREEAAFRERVKNAAVCEAGTYHGCMVGYMLASGIQEVGELLV